MKSGLDSLMETVMNSAVDRVLGEGGAARLSGIIEGMVQAAQQIKLDQAQIRRDQAQIMMAQENILDCLGRMRRDLRLPDPQTELANQPVRTQ